METKKSATSIESDILALYYKHMSCSKYPYMEVLQDRYDDIELRKQFKLITGEDCNVPNAGI